MFQIRETIKELDMVSEFPGERYETLLKAQERADDLFRGNPNGCRYDIVTENGVWMKLWNHLGTERIWAFVPNKE